MLRLPHEIIEKIFNHCDQTSFINLSQTCRRLQDIYKTYQFDTLPKYIGTIIITGTVDHDGDDNTTPFLNSVRTIQNKIFITHDINKLREFFIKYIERANQGPTIIVRKIKCSFKLFNENDEIELFDNSRFHTFTFDYKRRADVLNEYLFNEYINNAPSLIPLYIFSKSKIKKTLETEKEKLLETLSIIEQNKPQIDYIKKYIGNNKLQRNMYLISIKTEERLFEMSALRSRFGLHKIILTTNKEYNSQDKQLEDLIKKRDVRYHECFFDWINTLKTTKIIFNKEYNFHKL